MTSVPRRRRTCLSSEVGGGRALGGMPLHRHWRTFSGSYRHVTDWAGLTNATAHLAGAKCVYDHGDLIWGGIISHVQVQLCQPSPY